MLEIKLDKQFKKYIKRDQKSGKYKEDDFLELKNIKEDEATFILHKKQKGLK